ncbi:FAD-dependent oxidoreductase [Rhodococcus sp. P1Y]|uniref:FAD-dependent oxidoreductase n=1 Tax=Rhodococcus sp. P1Y TaxID=1302308 RepID=UPI000EABCDA8|nr:FAD-dependent oxidoreductase [Rhodococcus sp. P1Y]AYJ48976.1 4Fe-4S dicluster domain-containing protein [Rhodococcus sp. P1Y]
MAFAITQNCCNDASCLSVCPVNCIHPTPDEPDFGKTELLYIDPRSCIDCGACADACPVDAITRVSRLTGDQAIYADINADYYRDRPSVAEWGAPKFPPASINSMPRFDVAIVGTGPAACYAAQALLRVPSSRITFYDRLAVPGGLARFGVAPDHVGTRRIGEHFRSVFVHPRVTMKLGVDIGTDITHDDLGRRFDAVVYGTGADNDRPLDIPGIDLPGSLSARTLVGWYTGHPDVSADAIDLSDVRRVTIIGNGNVALDAARILTADPADLVGTDISPHALAALRGSAVTEVVVAARRGPEFAAFTRSEAQALVNRRGVDVAVSGPAEALSAIDELPISAPGSALQGVASVDDAVPGTARRVVFSFGRAPVRLNGSPRVDSVEFSDGTTAESDLVLLAIGYRGTPSPGMPFNEVLGAIRNVDGRVVAEDGEPMARRYVVGWAKRGATGGIGDNKVDAEETVDALLQDIAANPPEPKKRLSRLRTR